MAQIKNQTFIFSTGRRISAQRGVVGISPSLGVFQGYSDILIPSEPFLDDNDALTNQECVELADLMIEQWQAFKNLSIDVLT